LIFDKIIQRFQFISAFIALFIFQRFASVFAGMIADLFSYDYIDSSNVFMHISIHHIVQMMIVLLAIYFISKKYDIQFNLKFRQSKTGIIYTLIFITIICVYVLMTYFIGYKARIIQPYDYPLTATNICGTLSFQLLLSGPSEEILFRALPISIFLYMFKNKTYKWKNLVVIMLSCILFSLAHVSWDYSTLNFDWFQLIYAFILGVAYAMIFIKSKSIIYPMIMHSMSNFLMVGIGYLFMIFY
jgi:membrane protease YdiL (CAAX protease family)